MSEPFSQINTISEVYKFSNIQTKCPLNIVRICAVYRVQIYSDIHLVNMWHPNIFEYLFGN